MDKKITVALDNTGDFNTIKAAYDSIKENEKATIFVKNGAYFEKLIFEKPNITLKGEDREKTIIRYNDCALRRNENYEQLNTFLTATLKISSTAENFKMENITVENCAGYGKIVGQAVALFVDVDKAIIENCKIIGYQDTLLNAPYFLDLENNHNIVKRQYFKNCYIEGDVDFIFGGAVVIFDKCEIYSKKRPEGYNGFITAACTDKEREFGYVFMNCELTGAAKENTVYLGRPWRHYANVAFLNCKMGKHINQQHYCLWREDDPDNRRETCRNAEYNNYGENYSCDKAAPWVKVLTDKEAEKYNIKNIFDGWVPEGE